jgi:predicted nucleic acid-binding protein
VSLYLDASAILPTFIALHIAICTRVGDTLVTVDRRLAAAAEALGVRVVMVT